LSPLVAVMITDPSFTPRTRPVLSTVAISVLLLAHATGAAGMTFPRESYTVAVRRNEPPTSTTVVAGVTSTRLTDGASTTIVAVPLRPSLDAVIDAVPGDTAATIPVALTVATSDRFDDHVIVRPLSGCPAASRGCASSSTVCPTTRVAELGLTATEATGAGDTVIAATPLLPSTVAVITVLPGDNAAMAPLPLTLAI
jgi:hypothetical protein